MCRLFAFSFHKATPKHRRISVVDSFRALSLHGAVLPASSEGHGDGWGMVVYDAFEKNLQKYKSVSSAHVDDKFPIDSFLNDEQYQSGLVHLRKKTVGEACLENTHPFVHNSFAFIHNGTVSHADAYPNLASSCTGGTDSERLFRRFLEIHSTSKVSTLEAYIEMLKEAQVIYPEHSALNTMLHDGTTVYVSRSINLNSTKYKEDDLLAYYTLYIGKTDTGDVFVSSEMLPNSYASYMMLPNHSVTVIDTTNHDIHTVSLV
jgi:predicted glutamine amidotransferase